LAFATSQLIGCLLLLLSIDAFLPSLGLQLVGPYDVLAGKTMRHTGSSSSYLCHWRYYYDSPEFMTIIRGDDKKQFHLGYYRYVTQLCVRQSSASLVLLSCIDKSEVVPEACDHDVQRYNYIIDVEQFLAAYCNMNAFA